MNHNYPRGSQWRKWDLHFHSQSSFDYKDKSITDQELIDGLRANGIEAVAITDHHKIDTTRVKNLEKLAGKDLLILPGIEFRSELGGSELVHFIGLFSNTDDIDYIWKQIQVKCKIDDADILKRGGYERVICDFKETAKLIHELNGLVSVHAGKKSNSFERLKNDIKDDLEVNRCIDILELGNPTDSVAYDQIVFPNINRVIPLILSSDNHDIKSYSTKQHLWIKADLTFEGLKQIIYEPRERVKLQQLSPALDFDKSYFSEIAIEGPVDVFTGESLRFDKCTIPLNPNLVTIIGGRGTGKSVLINFLANGFKQFKEPQEASLRLANLFKVKWRKSITSQEEVFSLDKQHDLQFLFISQSEVKNKVREAKDLGNEIKKILDLESLSFDLATDELIQQYVTSHNSDLLWFDKRDESNNPINTRPYVQSEIDKNQTLLERLTTEENKEKLEKYSQNIKNLRTQESEQNAIKQLKTDLNQFKDRINKQITLLGKGIPSITFKSQDDVIDQLVLRLEQSILKTQKENQSIKEEFKDFKGDLSTLLSSVDTFKTSTLSLEKRMIEISSREMAISNSLSNKKSISSLIDVELTRQKNRINDQWKTLLEGKEGWKAEQKALMKKIINNKGINIEGEIIFNKSKFYELIKDQIDGRTFKGKNNPNELESLLGIVDYNGLKQFLLEIDESIGKVKYHLLTPIGEFENTFYDLRIRSSYLYVQPKITFDAKPLEKISVGQRGTIYLCLKLATNIFSQTIIFDQPEDDLDNDFIFKDLIEIFKEIKKYRQVVIVTHNANLVVNADAEQVIVATNTNEKLSYSSGSLENPDINKEVCNILEGGQLAFERRRNKYQLT